VTLLSAVAVKDKDRGPVPDRYRASVLPQPCARSAGLEPATS
jgi:hypothetical protein